MTVKCLEYEAGSDQAQGTAYQTIDTGVGNANDQSISGVLTLYAPSSTTYVKHFRIEGKLTLHRLQYGQFTPLVTSTQPPQ
jgi:hypothetical protein